MIYCGLGERHATVAHWGLGQRTNGWAAGERDIDAAPRGYRKAEVARVCNVSRNAD